MAEYRSEYPDGGFKKTFVAIAVVHLVLLGGLLLATLFQSKKNSDTVVWMNPGSFGGDSAAAGVPGLQPGTCHCPERRIATGEPAGNAIRNNAARRSTAADPSARAPESAARRPTV